MTGHQKRLRRGIWMILLVIAVAFLLTPSLVHAQSQSQAAGAVMYYADDGDQGTDIEQTVNIYYDGESGVDTYVETENDSYADWQDLGSLWIFGVGSEAQVYGDSSFYYDTGMQYGNTSDTGGDPVTAEYNPPWGYSTYGVQGLYAVCGQIPEEYDQYGCSWNSQYEPDGPQQGLYVNLQIPGQIPTTLSLTSSPKPSTYGQSLTFTATLSVNVTGESVLFSDGDTYIGSATINGTTATLPTSALTAGMHSIAAYYPGDSNYKATGSDIFQMIYPAGLVYGYTITPTDWPSGYAPNSNLLSYTDSVMGSWSFGYDSLNRLTSGSSSLAPYNGNSACWTYDSFGNRTGEAISSTPCSNSPAPTTWASFNSNNQVTGTTQAAGGYTYDSAGDVLNDGVNQYLYDAESRVCALYNGSTITGYLYNADGQRVAKGTLSSFSCSASFTPATQEIIGQNGEKLAETDSSGYWHTNIYGAGELFASYDPNGLHFLLNDWLGSRRVQTNSAGTTEQTCQNLPFGDELNCTSSDTAPNSFDFAGLEHDQESGLDHATARQYSSSMGQWTSPDSYDGSMNFGNPQSLNRYSYVGNAPLTFTDPSGMDGRGSGSTIESVLELAAVAIFDYATFDLFSHPSLTDSTKPRPDAQPWDEYHIHYGANIAGALGLPTTGGCEFGSCGSNLTAQQQAAITNAAQGWIGTPYVYGGCSRKGSDCSGSIIAIYAIAGITLPGRMTSGDFAHSSLFQRVTGNPEVGDVGVYPGHVDIFGGAAVGGFCPLHSNTDPCNVWSATHPGGNPFERANSGWFGTPVWYRYVGP